MRSQGLLCPVILSLLVLSCTPRGSQPSATPVPSRQPIAATPTPVGQNQPTATLRPETRVPTLTAIVAATSRPSPSPTIWPIDRIVIPLKDVIVELDDRCRTSYSLPILSEYADVTEIDTTADLAGDLCEVDCASRQWIAEGGSKVTLTVVRFAKDSRAIEEVSASWEKSRMREYATFEDGSGDPYTGPEDETWWGTLGAEGRYESHRGVLYLSIDWNKALQGYDVDWSPHDMENLAQLQYWKLYESLGTPLPRLLSAPIGFWCVP